MRPEEDGEFKLADVKQFLWRYRVLIGIVALLFGILAGVLAWRTKPYFKAEVVVTEVRDHGLGGAASLASQLGGLASLAGVNLGGGAGNSGQDSEAVLDSRHLTEEFIQRNRLQEELLRVSSGPKTLWGAVKSFKERVVTIRKDQRKGVITVDMQWTDPAVAAQWANGYIDLANELIRAKALDESNRNIIYLSEQLKRTDSVDLRKVMYNLIENETKNLMVANGRKEYAFEVVDPAVTPELKEGPHRALNTLVGLMLGFIFGSLLAFVVDLFRGSRARSATGLTTA